MLWTEYRPVIKIGPKGALGSHEIHPIHSVPSLGQSIVIDAGNQRSKSKLRKNEKLIILFDIPFEVSCVTNLFFYLFQIQ